MNFYCYYKYFESISKRYIICILLVVISPYLSNGVIVITAIISEFYIKSFCSLGDLREIGWKIDFKLNIFGFNIRYVFIKIKKQKVY